MRPPRTAICVILSVLAGSWSVQGADQDQQNIPTTPIGAAKIDITPDYPVRLAGYGGRRAESEGVAQRIWAKALAIGDDGGDGPAVLITVENCGMTPAIREAVSEALGKKFGVRSERLVISVSHTHTAPCLTDWAPFLFGEDVPPDHQERIDRYTRELTASLVEVAAQAIGKRTGARLWWGAGQVDFAMNRRVIQQGSWTGFGGERGGPVDHSLPILIARDQADKPLAILATYACHCTTLGGGFNQIAGDWAGYAQEYIEQDHPGAVALITIGCGADANPSPRGELDVCQQHGRKLADEVQRLLKTPLAPLDPHLTCREIEVELPFQQLPTEEQWRERASQDGAPGYHARQFLERLQRGDQIPSSLPYPVSTWTFGHDLAMVFLGGEVVVDYAIRMKSELDADRLWITAYANDVPCYIPSQRILREGGYEAESSMVYYARPTRLAPDTEEIVIDAVQKLLPAEFYSPERQADFPPPLSPDEALASLRTRPGVIVELAAAEPLVMDPVAFDWGPDGRLWVVEMRDYPNGMGWNGIGDPLDRPGGRIKLLSDDDGDGRYDRASLFLDEIPFPTGVKAWRGGILVSAAPEIFYAEDSDGDGVADRRETLYRGFGEGNQQHRVNGLRWGLDNWLYVGNGDSGGTVKSLKTGATVNVNGRDLRIQPDEGLLEAISGQTQFGRSCDDFGNWFGGNNSNPMWHYVLDDAYLRRNPHFAPPGITRQVSVQPGAAPVFPASRTLARFNDFDRANRFTSACSPIVFRDASREVADARKFTYTCEPVHNLVHREVIEADGVTFTSRRADDERESEFLASTDNWFRPVMVRTGPDGALWIADMYRFVIEHPTWIPVAWQRKLDLRAGDDLGRIYRVRLPGIPNARDWRSAQLPRFDTLDTAALVAALDDPNGTRRDMIHQLLLWQKDPAAVSPLKQLVRSADWPPASLHALYLLEAFGALDEELLERTIRSGSAAVARHAIRLAEPRLDRSPPLVEAFLARLNLRLDDPFSQQLQLQLAYSLGHSDDPRAARALAELALHDRGSPYVSAAVLSSVNPRNLSTVLEAVLSGMGSRADGPPEQLVGQLLALAVAFDRQDAIDQATAALLEPRAGRLARWQLEAADGLLQGLDKRGRSPQQTLSAPALQAVAAVFAEARRLATDPEANLPDRILAVRLLGRGGGGGDDLPLLEGLLGSQHPSPVQLAAAGAVARRAHAQAPQVLLQDWGARSPALRAEILDLLAGRAEWTEQLLAAVRGGEIPAGSIDARRRQQLAAHKNEAIRDQAAALFASTVSSRQDVLKQYASALQLSGEAERGKQLFEKHCGKCHRLEGVGHPVGPDLVALTDKSPDSLLVAILDPNRAVEDKFLDFVALTADGRQHVGMITSETGNSVTLTGQEGKQAVILRNELEDLRSTGKSMMPEGLEKELDVQGLADVIAYVRKVAYPPKQFPGNTPRVAPVRDDGSIRLFAMHSRIYGPSLVFEERYRNLGWWSSIEDHAIWDIDAPRAGPYRVTLDYACDDSTAGNRFALQVGQQTLGGAVQGTGSWDNYRSENVGTLDLPAGRSELLFRSDGPVQGALIDLRTIRLTPVDK